MWIIRNLDFPGLLRKEEQAGVEIKSCIGKSFHKEEEIIERRSHFLISSAINFTRSNQLFITHYFPSLRRKQLNNKMEEHPVPQA
jgi:hypothetical protein